MNISSEVNAKPQNSVFGAIAILGLLLTFTILVPDGGSSIQKALLAAIALGFAISLYVAVIKDRNIMFGIICATLLAGTGAVAILS
ncbi:hypothetical protein [Dietzia timorensis]|uniref:Uncharacterized protein n=1 Tax=Dietzia timorensis TaxID=499555 RepID=A0A173LJ02_9ACTN|nr:hypothetical protein [Dietzia timorensis]ANI91759.1 Hypothetical protein BJL86_0966 [Dietzia timorensis]